MWPGNRATLVGYLRDSMRRFDRTYDPNGDGLLSEDELKNWNPNQSPVQIQNDLRKLDLHGNLQRPIIIAHGTYDVTVAPGESIGYMRLVESRLGVVKRARPARGVLHPRHGPRRRAFQYLAERRLRCARRLGRLAPKRRHAGLASRL